MHGVTGSSYDFGARMYDSRLGRFLSLDPKMKEYPNTSPYSFAANNPILLIDKNGESPHFAALFAVGAITSFVSQVAVQYAIHGDMKTALQKVDYYDVVVTGLETMAFGPSGMTRGLQKTFGKIALAECVKASIDVNFDENDNFEIKILGTTKSGTEFAVDFTSSLIMNKVDELLGSGLNSIKKSSSNELKEFKRLNNMNAEELQPNIVVNNVVQSAEFESAFKEGLGEISKIMNSMGTNEIKGALNKSTDSGNMSSSGIGNVSLNYEPQISKQDNTRVE